MNLLHTITQVRMPTIARQGLKRQAQVAWYLIRKDMARTARTVTARFHV